MVRCVVMSCELSLSVSRRVVFGELNYPHIVSISGYERHHDMATLSRNNTDRDPACGNPATTECRRVIYFRSRKSAGQHARPTGYVHKLAKTPGCPASARLRDQSKPNQPSTYPMPSSGIIWNFQPATVIGLPCLVTTTMRTGSAGKPGYVGKSRQRLAAQLMRQAGCDLPRICCDLPRISRSCGSRSACLVSACVVSALLERRPANMALMWDGHQSTLQRPHLLPVG